LQREARVLAARQAAQACLAVVAAIAAGHAISATRWYWAAFTAFLIFQGAKSRQETTAKAMQTVAGTILGVLAGLLVATLLHGHSETTVLATIVAVFLAYYASTAAYATMIFWFTIVIGLVFGMLGYFPPSLLALRLEETLIGTACGLASAFLLRIDRTADPLDLARRVNLETVRALVSAAVSGLCQPDRPPLDTEVAAARRSLFSLAAIAIPRMQGMIIGLPAPARRGLTLLRACNHWAEELALVSRDPARRLDQSSQQVVRVLGARVDEGFAEVLDGRSRGGQLRPESGAGAGDVSEPIIRLLQNLENGLERLAVLSRSGRPQ
jgi:uncharacterized membrane protein YccC